MTVPSEVVLRAQERLGLDLHRVNAEASVPIPMPTVALVDSLQTADQ